MKIKGLNINKIRLFGIGLICVFGFTFQGCEDSLDVETVVFNEDRFISIPNLEDPEILMRQPFVDDYLEAYSRFSRHVVVKRQKIVWDIQSGSDINISEDLFAYIKVYLDEVNAGVENGLLKVVIERGVVRVFKKTVSGLVWLKSANESTGCDQVNFAGSSQSVGEGIVDAMNCFNNGSYSIEDLFDLNSYNFSITNRDVSGYFTMGGYKYRWSFMDITSGGSNNIPNYICKNDREFYGKNVVDMIRYCSGNPAFSITSYSSEAAYYLQNFLH